MAQHNELGVSGEDRAVYFLRSKGYKIRHRNWLSGKKELDIVAEYEDTLVIIEVKTRSTITFEHPEEAITYSKIRNIIAATESYIFEFDLMMATRFDIISVIPDKDQGYIIEHIEDAFLPPVN
jgi:putative endonuclease